MQIILCQIVGEVFLVIPSLTCPKFCLQLIKRIPLSIVSARCSFMWRLYGRK